MLTLPLPNLTESWPRIFICSNIQLRISSTTKNVWVLKAKTKKIIDDFGTNVIHWGAYGKLYVGYVLSLNFSSARKSLIRQKIINRISYRLLTYFTIISSSSLQCKKQCIRRYDITLGNLYDNITPCYFALQKI